MKSTISNKLLAGKKLLAPGVQKPIYLLNFVTNSCNAACEHCFYWEELNTKKREELTVEEHGRVAQKLGPMFQVTFTGGSPELRKDLPELAYQYHKYCSPSNMTFCMLGYNTSRIIEHAEKMLTQCEGQKISIGISLDGLGKEHDEYRKLNGLFDRVVKTVHELDRLKKDYPNLRIDIGMVVHGLNIEKVESSAQWVRKNLPIDKLKPILVRGNPFNLSTLDKNCIDVYHKIVDRDSQYLLSKSKAPNFLDRVIHAKENVSRELIKEISQTNKSVINCSGGRETAVMYPTGDIAGCEMREDILGNIRRADYDFSKVWFSEKGNQFRKTVGKVDECHGCYHHCFISPAIFRTPKMWPRIAKSILQMNEIPA